MKTTQGLEFDGVGAGPKKGSSRFAGNKSGLTGVVNAGRGPTRGNDGTCHDPIGGKSVTKDARKTPPATATGTAQYRGVGGTTVKKPTNPDSIRTGQSGNVF